MHLFQKGFHFCINTHRCQKLLQQAYDPTGGGFFAIPNTLGLVFLSGRTVVLVVADL